MHAQPPPLVWVVGAWAAAIVTIALTVLAGLIAAWMTWYHQVLTPDGATASAVVRDVDGFGVRVELVATSGETLSADLAWRPPTRLAVGDRIDVVYDLTGGDVFVVPRGHEESRWLVIGSAATTGVGLLGSPGAFGSALLLTRARRRPESLMR